jgi:hypothetical protein
MITGTITRTRTGIIITSIITAMIPITIMSPSRARPLNTTIALPASLSGSFHCRSR